MGATDDAEVLLREWLHRARESQWGHYGAEKRLLRVHYAIGIPLLGLTTFSGTAVFATLSTRPDPWFQILIGVTSVAAAILGALQTFLRSSDRAAGYRAAATRYASLRRRLEQVLVLGLGDGNDSRVVDGLREQLSELAEQSPPIPQRVWKQTERVLKARG